MKLTIVIDQNNAAFVDSGVNEETARILRQLADRIEDYQSGENEQLADGQIVNIRDLNGNRCGWMENVNA